MTTLSLNAHDREALSLIEEALSVADPQLAAKLSAFNRMADGEAMPARERIAANRRRTFGLAARVLRRGRPGTPGRVWLIPLAVWLVVSLVLFSVALVLSRSGTRASCAEWQGFVCVKSAASPVPPGPSGHRGGPVSLVPRAR